MSETGLPVLESGDRLTRDEFHRRYCQRPDIKKAELVEGVVYVPSPTRFTVHGRQHGLAELWLGTYAANHPGVEVASNTTVFLDADSEVQPDIYAFYTGSDMRGVRITDDGYLRGAPPFVMEIAASSASYDLHDKLRAYAGVGVQEYVVWRVLDDAIDWLRLRGDVYERVEPNEHGMIESAVFPGLRLDVPRMLACDRAGMLAALSN